MLGRVHITPQLVQTVRDTVDIVEIASENTKLRKAGRRFSGLCPLHREKTPSFSVDPEKGLFYCFGCGRGGDAIKLHMSLSGDEFPEAIETLARRYGIPLPKLSASSREKSGPDLEPVLEAAAEHFRKQLRSARDPRDYLEQRKIPPDLVERFGLGFAPPGFENLLEALHPKIALQHLHAAGLTGVSDKNGKPFDRFRNRLMFPIRDVVGRLVGFGGRAMDDHPAKYLNTAETVRFQKGRILYGLNLAKRPIREGRRVCLVEGYFDVLGAVAAGIEWVVASMGTALTVEQAKVLSRYTDEVLIGYDGDRAGEEAYRRILPMLLAEGLGVRRCRFGEGHDPDSLRLAEGPEAVVEAIEGAKDAVVMEMQRLVPRDVHSDPRRQAAAGKSVTSLLMAVPDGILRYGYARHAADRLGVPVDLLWRRVGGGSSESRASKDTPIVRRKEVRSLEERLLQLLLEGEEELPGAGELPPPEAFLSRPCRNIYRSFYDLYSKHPGDRPDPKRVLGELEGEGEEVDQLARLLLEGSSASQKGELEATLGQITRRWRQQRLRELAGEISGAQQAGNQSRIDELLEEKLQLSWALHKREENRERHE